MRPKRKSKSIEIDESGNQIPKKFSSVENDWFLWKEKLKEIGIYPLRDTLRPREWIAWAYECYHCKEFWDISKKQKHDNHCQNRNKEVEIQSFEDFRKERNLGN